MLEHARSGLSLRAFAERAGVSVNTLAYWKYRRRIAGEARSPVFVPVKLVDDLHGVRSELVVEIGGAHQP